MVDLRWFSTRSPPEGGVVAKYDGVYLLLSLTHSQKEGFLNITFGCTREGNPLDKIRFRVEDIIFRCQGRTSSGEYS
jgi:hypothetical protein